jgi:hypothetical protein
MTKIDWKQVDYHNALRFLEIMKTWKPRGQCWCTQADIERQERIVAECKAQLKETSGETMQ